MAVVRKKWIVLGVIAVVVAAYTLLVNWYDAPLRRARRISGLEIPSSSKLLFAEDTTSGFLDDGTVLIVFSIPSNFAPTSEAECNLLGYQYGVIVRDKFSFWPFHVDDYYDSNRASCYYFELSYDASKLIIVQGQKFLASVNFM